MFYFFATLAGALALPLVTGARRLGNDLERSQAMRAGTARMPEGATHEIA